jgi:Sec-independent protein translocase protein TatA
MDIFGIGIGEFTFIVIIAIIVLGPKDMAASGKSVGRWFRKIILSPEWSAMRKTGEEIQKLPNKLMREAMLEDLEKEVQQISSDVNRTITDQDATKS